MMKYELDKTDGHARRGRLKFERGVVETPAFMPVGTYGTVKGMTPEETRCTNPFRQYFPFMVTSWSRDHEITR